MPVATCPPPGDLERLFLGGLPDADADHLEQHVLECAPCLQKLKALLHARETLSGTQRAETHGDGDDSSVGPVVEALIQKLESLRPAKSPLPKGTAMITFACSACQKKLSVKENLAGKKVKCPGCGQLVLVPAPAPAHVVGAGNEEMRTLPPVSSPDAPTPAPAPAIVGENPTQPPESKPDATMAVKHDSRHESSLTDFLAPPQADDELGRLGKYRILKILGHGGMGVVYRGEDLKLKRTVAIKAMLPTLAASASCGKRFLREAEAMAAVEHDHVVRIYQIDEERGIPFMAMEFLKGEPLDERLKRDEQIPLDEVLRIGREIAEGLGAAHSTGLIHRDIKPGNIWLEAPRNRVKILDFGLARAATQEAGLTQQGAIIGTPATMAPEQGRGAEVDARCDLFSLGVVLYRLCTGNQPFHGPDTVSTLMAVAMHDPVAPIKVDKELPPELSDLVMKLLEKDPADRVATAAEVVQAIQAMERTRAVEKIAAEKTEAITASPPRSAGKRSRQDSAPAPSLTVALPRRRSMALIVVGVLGAFGALALLAGGVIFYLQTNNGTVRIEINDPDIQVAFDNKDLLFKGIDKQDIRVSPGEHGLHIKRGDLEFDSDKFILKRGETITLKVEWLKDGKLQVVQRDKVLGAKELAKVEPIGPVAAAHYALRFSGQDQVVVLPEALSVDAAGDFTMEGFVNLSGNHALLVGTPAIAVQTFTQPWRFQVYAAEGKPVSINDTKGPASQYANRRVHIAGVRASGKLRLFVDGRLAGAESLDGKLFTRPNQVLRIGPADGVIDEVRISKVARYDKDFTPAQRFEPDADTQALYHFDEGSGDVLKDSSGNNHHGKIVGAKWVKADGVPISPPPRTGDYALRFDGETSVVEIPSLRVAKFNEWCVEAKIAVDVARGRVTLTQEGAWSVHLYRTDSQWIVHSNGMNTGGAGGNNIIHIAAVRKGDELKLFINGKLVSKKPATIPISPDPTEPFLLGAERAIKGLQRHFKGTMDEVRVSKAVRYDKDFTPAKRFEPDADTLALYHFDEGSGDVLKDSSGNGHHGKIVGAKWVNADGTPIATQPAGGYVLQFLGFQRGDTPAPFVRIDTLKTNASAELTLEAYVSHLQHNEGFVFGTKNFRIRQRSEHWAGFFIAGGATLLENPAMNTVSVAKPGPRTHLALVKAPKSLRFFVDGKLVGSKDFPTPIALKEEEAFQIGGEGLGMRISEVRISKIARYDKDFTPAKRFEPDADTLALYHCDEGSGDVLKDSSGNGHHGKIVGAEWVKADGSLMAPAPKEIDLLKLIDPKRDAVVGEWTFLGSKLAGHEGANPGRLMIPYEPPSEYQIEMVVERKNKKGGQLNIGLVVGGQQTVICVDGFAWPGASGLETVDGKAGSKNETSHEGQLLPLDRPTPIVVRVRNKEVTFICDQKTIFQWTGEPARLGVHISWVVPNPRVLFLGSQAGIHIHKMTLTPLREPSAGAKTFKNALGMEFANVPKGKAWLGGTQGKPGTTEVQFKHDFYLGVYEVTQAEWENMMGTNPSQCTRTGSHKDAVKDIADADLKRLPVDGVSWDDCQVFLKKLNEKTKEPGWIYRLPTEAEWEYACRGGPMTDKAESAFDYYFDERYGNRKINFGSKGPVKVGSYAPNRLGLFDMHGNVWEWCQGDAPGQRAIRGGGWSVGWGESANGRRGVPPTHRNASDGLRVARIPLAMVALDPAWLKQVAAMKAEQQVEAVKAELMKRNPGFDGKVTPAIDKAGVVAELNFASDNVTDISPVRALRGLTRLLCIGSTPGKGKLADLSPLNDMQLTSLNCGNTIVADLSPLRNMKLTALNISGSKVADLSPLKEMPLTSFHAGNTPVPDLSPLQGMKLTALECHGTKVTDLAPLKGMPLKTLQCDFRPERDAEILRTIKTLETINGKTAAAFWKELDKK